MNRKIVALLALFACAPLGADAQSYRCVGKDGKRYYGSAIPPACYGRPVEQLNAQGMVVKRIDPAAEEKERRSKAAAEAEKRENEAAAREVARRNHALLATYTSEKDIDEARARALADNSKAIREVEARIEVIRKRRSAAKLPEEIVNAETELKAQQHLLEAKTRETEAINARYDEDKKRYAQITGAR